MGLTGDAMLSYIRGEVSHHLAAEVWIKCLVSKSKTDALNECHWICCELNWHHLRIQLICFANLKKSQVKLPSKTIRFYPSLASRWLSVSVKISEFSVTFTLLPLRHLILSTNMYVLGFIFSICLFTHFSLLIVIGTSKLLHSNNFYVVYLEILPIAFHVVEFCQLPVGYKMLSIENYATVYF